MNFLFVDTLPILEIIVMVVNGDFIGYDSDNNDDSSNDDGDLKDSYCESFTKFEMIKSDIVNDDGWW